MQYIDHFETIALNNVPYKTFFRSNTKNMSILNGIFNSSSIVGYFLNNNQKTDYWSLNLLVQKIKHIDIASLSFKPI